MVSEVRKWPCAYSERVRQGSAGHGVSGVGLMWKVLSAGKDDSSIRVSAREPNRRTILFSALRL